MRLRRVRLRRVRPAREAAAREAAAREAATNARSASRSFVLAGVTDTYAGQGIVPSRRLAIACSFTPW